MPHPSVSILDGARDRAGFMSRFGDIVEHSPWVAERAFEQGPFRRPLEVHAALMRAIGAASVEDRLALFRAHPELAGSEAKAGTMTASSTSEQGRLGLTSLDAATAARLTDLNARYRQRFDMPCIIALRLHDTLASVLATFERRLANDREAETAEAIGQIGHIVRGRLAKRLAMDGGRLSTHVLDTAAGIPAAAMRVDLSMHTDGEWHRIATVATNANGRTDAPLLTDIAMSPGVYRLDFYTGDYFRARGCELADPPFLDVVPLQFGLADPQAHYHVPLLCSPWSFTTYRGS